jgi:2-polyprenyl-3-methyl-5-hydroxy-6-metoxy-1,4-benzoquinol methylase
MADDLTRRLGLNLKYDYEPRDLPWELSQRFRRLDLGEEGKTYVAQALATRPGKTKTSLHRLLRVWMSDFDVNGLLDMYPMHLLGTSQWQELLGKTPMGRHLDVGAGSGDITKTFAPLVHETVTTETSRMMARKLRKSGFRCFEADLAESDVPDPGYEVVTCLNVIDRCAKPLSLLTKLVAALVPGGRLVLATPLPFDPFVYEGATSVAPRERLPLPKTSWERSVASLVENVITPLGLETEVVSRVPYLCRGDSDRPLYVLDDVLLVCRKPGARPLAELPDGPPTRKSVQSG